MRTFYLGYVAFHLFLVVHLKVVDLGTEGRWVTLVVFPLEAPEGRDVNPAERFVQKSGN